jgi:hypothetical protein
VTESKFRERRSAYRDEADEPEETAPSAAAEEVPPAEIVQPTPPAEPPPAEPPPAEPTPAGEIADRPASAAATEIAADDEEGAGMEAGMDLDRLAEMEVPEPSFLELIEPHVEMALRFLGELPLSPDGARRILPRWARREIDLLGLLEERTRGNLPADEQRYLVQALDQLRTLYLKVSR